MDIDRGYFFVDGEVRGKRVALQKAVSEVVYLPTGSPIREMILIQENKRYRINRPADNPTKMTIAPPREKTGAYEFGKYRVRPQDRFAVPLERHDLLVVRYAEMVESDVPNARIRCEEAAHLVSVNVESIAGQSVGASSTLVFDRKSGGNLVSFSIRSSAGSFHQVIKFEYAQENERWVPTQVHPTTLRETGEENHSVMVFEYDTVNQPLPITDVNFASMGLREGVAVRDAFTQEEYVYVPQ